MRIVAGAVLCLAGAVVFSAGTVADAIVSASGKSGPSSGSTGILVGGVLLGLVGLVVFVAGLVESRHGRRNGSESGYAPANAPFVPGLSVRQRAAPEEAPDGPTAATGAG
jgi:drug/metabolite transporter (DMT)-like permease